MTCTSVFRRSSESRRRQPPLLGAIEAVDVGEDQRAHAVEAGAECRSPI